MGIVSGASALPEKWTKPLNDKIATLCINLTSWGGIWVPKTVTELTDRVLRVTPRFLDVNDVDILLDGGYTINCRDSENLYCPVEDCPKGHLAGHMPRGLTTRELVELSPNVVRHNFTTHLVILDYGDDIYFNSREIRKLKVIIINNNVMLQQMWCKLRIHTPDWVNLPSGAGFSLPLGNFYGERSEAIIAIDASEFTGERLEVIVDITFEGRHTSTPVKAMFLRNPGQ
jgi:hypothetical protein